MRNRFFCLLAGLIFSVPAAFLAPQTKPPAREDSKSVTDSAIHFVFQAIDFKLDSNESPEHHAPETMEGGVAVFDYNNDGKLDIFFANGANLKTLKKDSPKYYNRLFENDGKGQIGRAHV